MKKTKKKAKSITGTVISDKMDKTVVVAVERKIMHPVYHKFIKSRKTYKAHDESNECKAGDKVVIVESRPISKDKRWKVKSVVEKAQTLEG